MRKARIFGAACLISIAAGASLAFVRPAGAQNASEQMRYEQQLRAYEQQQRDYRAAMDEYNAAHGDGRYANDRVRDDRARDGRFAPNGDDDRYYRDDRYYHGATYDEDRIFERGATVDYGRRGWDRGQALTRVTQVPLAGKRVYTVNGRYVGTVTDMNISGNILTLASIRINRARVAPVVPANLRYDAEADVVITDLTPRQLAERSRVEF